MVIDSQVNPPFGRASTKLDRNLYPSHIGLFFSASDHDGLEHSSQGCFEVQITRKAVITKKRLKSYICLSSFTKHTDLDGYESNIRRVENVGVESASLDLAFSIKKQPVR